MAEQTQKHDGPEVPGGQKVFDNWLLLFVLSTVLNILLYNVWELLELSALPHLK